MSARGTRSLRTLWLIFAVCAAPVVASFAVYYLMPAPAGGSYGELLPTQPAPHLAGTRADGRAWTIGEERGHWVVVVAAAAACDDACAARLYATRQARTMQGRERERVRRVWLVVDDAAAPEAARLAEHPDLEVVRADPRAAERLPRGADAIYLVDPLGNQVLAWPSSPDIRGMGRDLSRLLKASRIG
ncbi:MAG: hypothetical protein ABI585_02885 [Betaproteobacteria bacterium]